MKLALYKSQKHLFNRLVSWWTRSPYSHVELAMPFRDSYLCYSSSYTDGGVRMKLMPLPPENWDVIDIDGNEAAAVAWFTAHDGQNYDVLGLFGFVVRRGIQDQQKWFCSEAVAAALGMSEPWRYDPATLYAALANGKAESL